MPEAEPSEAGLRSTPPPWAPAVAPAPGRALMEDLTADVCVVGGGVTGLTTAYFLRRQGLDVVLVGDGPPGGGETRLSTAHLSSLPDGGLARLERRHGPDTLRAVWKSHAAAIDVIEAIVSGEAIDCQLERPDGFLLAHDDRCEPLELELAAARRAGLGAEMLPRAPLDGFFSGPCLRLPRQGQLDPALYSEGLAARLRQGGVRLLWNTRVTSIDSGAPARVETDNGTVIAAAAVVAATHAPIGAGLKLHARQAAFRTYVVAAPVPRGSVTRALYWDTSRPGRYARLRPHTATQDMLLAGGEDHRTGRADDAELRFERLERWARERFPGMSEVRLRWSGQILETSDGLPLIGRSPAAAPNVYVATGFSGSGLTHGTIAAVLLSDLILGRTNEWAGLYDPGRRSLRSAGAWLREGLSAAASLCDRLAAPDAAGPEEIPRGSGAVLRRGWRKVAVYRDEAGALHGACAVCPHRGGMLGWNHAEGSWDCGRHGSRFSAHGTALNGPAHQDLSPADEEFGIMEA